MKVNKAEGISRQYAIQYLKEKIKLLSTEQYTHIRKDNAYVIFN